MERFPKWMLENTGYRTARGFKRNKRYELRLLDKALNQLRSGCAWFPSGTSHVEAIEHHVKALRNELSAKNWGR